MRIWYISPEYYDKKGILAQWNEGNILKNIIVQKRRDGAWVNHPYSKRVLRYKTNQHRAIINTYLNAIRNYGVENQKIKFKEQYLEKEHIDNDLKIPILPEQIESDYNDALFKMKTRDKQIYEKLQKFKGEDDKYVSKVNLLKPFYLEMDLKKYENACSDHYKKFCEENEYRICGYEVPEELSDKWDKIRGTYQKSVYKTRTSDDVVRKEPSKIKIKAKGKNKSTESDDNEDANTDEEIEEKVEVETKRSTRSKSRANNKSKKTKSRKSSNDTRSEIDTKNNSSIKENKEKKNKSKNKIPKILNEEEEIELDQPLFNNSKALNKILNKSKEINKNIDSNNLGNDSKKSMSTVATLRSRKPVKH